MYEFISRVNALRKTYPKYDPSSIDLLLTEPLFNPESLRRNMYETLYEEEGFRYVVSFDHHCFRTPHPVVHYLIVALNWERCTIFRLTRLLNFRNTQLVWLWIVATPLLMLFHFGILPS
jgi:hypothetical protein